MLCFNRLKNSARVTALTYVRVPVISMMTYERDCMSKLCVKNLSDTIQTFVSRAQDTFCGSKKNCLFHDCLSFRLCGLMIGEECIQNIPQDAEDIKATNPITRTLFSLFVCVFVYD